MPYIIIPVTPFEQNCTILWCEKTKKAFVIDPGGEVDRIMARLQKENLSLSSILVTHGHVDHVGGVVELAEKTQAPVEGPHEADLFLIDDIPQKSRMYGFPEARPFVPNRWLKDGDTVRAGELELEVLHCPGHTPGHVVFYNRQEALLIVGDVLFQGSIGRTDFPKGNHADLIRSIKEKLLPLGDDVCFIPGHGAMSTLGQESRFNPFLE